uniref:MyTH4 domain-containing protein n=1 Tax=Naja naja TaxID=35670 RepID=A0A8C7E7T4_NAJNA
HNRPLISDSVQKLHMAFKNILNSPYLSSGFCSYLVGLYRKCIPLRNELLSQVATQLWKNPDLEQCQRGWVLMATLLSAFTPSPALEKPLKLIVYGGRQHLPFLGEMKAFLVNEKEISGSGWECLLLGSQSFGWGWHDYRSLSYAGKMIRPLHQEEYVLDFLLEESSIELLFRRITWKIPLHFDNEIYINIHYNQALQEYMTGTLLQQTSKLEEQLGILALLQHWARGYWNGVPQLQWLGFEPQSCFSRDGNLPWKTCTADVVLLMSLTYYTPSYLVSLLAEHVIQLPLFGYNVFSVERISAPNISSPCIVGVNQKEIMTDSAMSTMPVFPHVQSNQIIIPLNQILRMKSLRPFSAAGFPGIEINYGSIENPKTIKFELQQVTSIVPSLYRNILNVYCTIVFSFFQPKIAKAIAKDSGA